MHGRVGSVFCFPCDWPFARGIHRSPGNFPCKGPVTRSFDVFFDQQTVE